MNNTHNFCRAPVPFFMSTSYINTCNRHLNTINLLRWLSLAQWQYQKDKWMKFDHNTYIHTIYFPIKLSPVCIKIMISQPTNKSSVATVLILSLLIYSSFLPPPLLVLTEDITFSTYAKICQIWIYLIQSYIKQEWWNLAS